MLQVETAGHGEGGSTDEEGGSLQAAAEHAAEERATNANQAQHEQADVSLPWKGLVAQVCLKGQGGAQRVCSHVPR